MTIVGIDPGLDGALVGLTDNGTIHDASDMPTMKIGSKRRVDPAGLVDLLRGYDHAVVERVHSMPKQGVASSFSFGQSFGTILGALAALGIPYELVTPQRWQKAMLDGQQKGKDSSRLVARQLWPDDVELFKRKKDHNRGDAALMAEWMRRRLGVTA